LVNGQRNSQQISSLWSALTSQRWAMFWSTLVNALVSAGQRSTQTAMHRSDMVNTWSTHSPAALHLGQRNPEKSTLP